MKQITIAILAFLVGAYIGTAMGMVFIAEFWVDRTIEVVTEEPVYGTVDLSLGGQPLQGSLYQLQGSK